MSDDELRPITPPPSVGDVLTSMTAHEPRIGRVDFSTRLAEAEAVAAAGASDEGSDATTSEQTDTAEVREVAAATPEPPSPVVEPPSPVVEPPSPVVEPPFPVVELVETTPRPPAPRLPRALTSEVPADLVRTVGEVADAVVARMVRAQDTTLQYLAALEAEALRHCELLTAQAELDAELIRLHARRDAHAIITSAQIRAGEGSVDEASTALIEMGDALAHVAETTETAAAPKRRRPPRRSEKS